MTDTPDWSGGAPEIAAEPAPLPLLPPLGHEIPLYRTDDLAPARWLARRKAGKTIGASQVAAVMQRNPYSTPIQVATVVKGLADVEFGPEEMLSIEIGKACEGQIRRIAAVSLKVPILRPGQSLARYITTWPQVLRHPTVECFTCNLDGVVFLDDLRMPLECKWTSWRNRAAWRALAETGDIVPALGTSVFAYYMQVQAQLAVTGLSKGILIGIVGEDAANRMLLNVLLDRQGDDTFDPKPFDVYQVTIERDEAMIADMERVIPRFHKRYIVGDELPPITDPVKDMEALRAAYRAPATPGIQHLPELDDLCRRYLGILSKLKEGEARRDQRKAEILRALTLHSADAATTGAHTISYKKRVDGVPVFRVRESQRMNEE